MAPYKHRPQVNPLQLQHGRLQAAKYDATMPSSLTPPQPRAGLDRVGPWPEVEQQEPGPYDPGQSLQMQAGCYSSAQKNSESCGAPGGRGG